MTFKDTMSLMDRFIKQYGRLPTEVDPDYLEMLRMTKYRILDVPDQTPGKCDNCGASKNDGRKYLDYGRLIDWHGTVYLCGLCIKDFARSFGLFDELEKERDDLVARGAEIEELHRKGAKLHEVVIKTLEEFERYYAHVHTTGDEPIPDNSTDVGNDSPTNERATNETEPDSTKQVAVSGRTYVPKLTDLIDK